MKIDRSYTVLIVSRKAARIKKLILSPFWLKIGAVALGFTLLFSALLIRDYLENKQKIAELKEIGAETRIQQTEIRSFLEKIALLETQLERLKEMEKQLERDLQEISQWRPKRASPASPRKKTSLAKKETSGTPLAPSEEISILERERPQLLSRLHWDLRQLGLEFSRREQTFQEWREFLKAQKSILLAAPSLWPVFGRISSGFGDTRLEASSGGTRPHKGVDIAVPIGTPILAPADGVVSFSGREAEYGRLVCLDHGQGYSTMFGHLHEVFVRPGQRVFRGERLGTVGLSGNSTGPHLHYEVRLHGTPANPAPFLRRTS